MKEPKFQIYIPVKITKSLKASENGDIDFEVEGCLHEDGKDLFKDPITANIIDTTNLLKFGRLKYEHENHPAKNIGFLTHVEKLEKSIPFKGRVFAARGDEAEEPSEQYKLAKALMDDYNNIQAWNNKYKDNPRQMGVSLEGPMVVNKSTNKPTLILATDLVFTTGPVNQGGFADAVQKSLSASYTVNPSDMTGADTLKTESINNKTKKRGTKMKFADKPAAIAHFVKNGATDTEAELLATEHFAVEEKITRSLKSGATIITDALTAIESDEEKLEASEKKIIKLNRSLKSSLEAENGQLDGEGILTAQSEAISQVNTEIMEIKRSLHSSMKAILGAQKELLVCLDGVNAKSDSDAIVINNLGEEVTELRKSLKAVTGGLSMETPKEPGENKNENSNDGNKELTDEQRVEKINKSLSTAKIREALVNVATSNEDFSKILGNYDKEGFSVEVGIARMNKFAYKSLSAATKKVVDEKLSDEIKVILATEENK